MTADRKPLGGKAYGSIPHLPGSKRGPGDHGLSEQQAAILTEGRRGWTIVVQEKLDGTCMSVAKIDGQIVALGRSGYLAESAPYLHMRAFATWVERRRDRFDALLSEGERVVGEWMLMATGIRYWIPTEDDLFVAFDIMRGAERTHPFKAGQRCSGADVSSARVLYMLDDHCGRADPANLHAWLMGHGQARFHAEAAPEGLVYRAIDLNGRVSFLGKWVRPDFEPGKYLGQHVYDYPIQWLLPSTDAA